MGQINVAIIGVGNCASSLYQGFTYYKNNKNSGIMKHNIGGYNLDCFKIVCAFDVDKRKVNKSLNILVAAPEAGIKLTIDLENI